MYISKNNLRKMSVDDLIFFFVALTFFLFPIGNAFPLISIGCAVAVCLFSGRIFKLKYLFRKKWFFPVIFFVLLPWIGLLYSKDLELGINYALKTKYWIAVFLTAGFVCNEQRVEILIRVFWVSLFCGSVIAFLQYIDLFASPKSGYLGFGLVYTVLSMYLLIGILTASYYFKTFSNWKEKSVIIVLLISFLFHLSILEGRNGYFVLILISPFIVHNLTFKLPISVKLFILFVLIGCLSISPIVQKRVKTSLEQLKHTETIFEGTLDLKFPRPFMFHTAVKLLIENPILGIGTGSLKSYTEKTGYPLTHPHNSILYMGVSFGIVGIVCCLWLFGKMVSISWANRGSPLGYFVFSICVVIFLGGFFDTLILNSGTSLLLPMGYGLLNHIEHEEL